MAEGKLKYLTITGYKDEGLKSKVGQYKVMLNPNKFTETMAVNYSDQQGSGMPGTPPKYENSPPSNLKFDLLFDATGVVDAKRTDLDKEISDFKKVVYDYNGDLHATNYLKLIWGSALLYGCRLKSLSLEYTLFAANGKPLRAKAAAEFMAYRSFKTIAKKANKKSPDMTHRITVKEGDNLPALAQQVYGDQKYYLQVARHNHLYNYRKLSPGTVITFPPLA